MYHDELRGYDSLHDFAKGYKHICSPSPTKKVTSRGQGAGVKHKIQGAGPFFGWILADNFQRLAPEEKSRISRPIIHRYRHDGTNSRILCQRAQIAKQAFLSENTFVLAKGVQPQMFSFTNQKRWLQEAEAQVPKIKSKGLDLFLAEYLRMIFKGWPHRKKVASPGRSSIDSTWWDEFKNFVSTRPNCKTGVSFWKYICPCKSGTTTDVQLHQPKKVTSRGRGAGVKNKIQGAGPFLTEYLRIILNGWPHRKKVASPGQSSTDRTWWDEFKNFVSTRPKCKTGVFFLKIHLSMQKGANTFVQLHQHNKWAGNVRIRDLICSRGGLFAKIVILATQKIGLATTYVNTWFNLGGCENPKHLILNFKFS